MNRKANRVLALSASFTLLLGVASAAAQRGDVRAAVEAANKKFSTELAQGNAAALAAHYTADAQVFPANSDIVAGRGPIQQFWQAVIDSGVKEATLTTLEVKAQGNLAYEVGTYAMKGESGKPLDSGKYVVVWKREGGRWKLHRDIWNTSMPPPGP